LCRRNSQFQTIDLFIHFLQIQLCAQTGNLAICELLLGHGADPFKSAASSSFLSASAFSIAAARGHSRMVRLFLGCCSFLRRNSGRLLITNENEGDCEKPVKNPAKIKFAMLTEMEKRAFEEAVATAAEMGQMEIVRELRGATDGSGRGRQMPNGRLWLNYLEWMTKRRSENISGNEEEEEEEMAQLLAEFGPRMGEELMATEDGGKVNTRKAQKRAELFAELVSFSREKQLDILAN
jgi:hypothetical protein